MRIGILSDIHGNYEALKASYKALTDYGCDKIICIGDIVGYGARPKECIEFIREKQIPSVKGNHDYYSSEDKETWDIQPYASAAITWTRHVLSDNEMTWLKALPYRIDEDDVIFIHSSLDALDGASWPYILDTKTALFHFFLQDKQFAFFGHTHIPLFFSYSRSQTISIEILRDRKISRRSTSKYLINPGSVGQPRDFDSRSSVVVFNNETREVKTLRVSYDIKKVQNQIVSAGLPQMLAERLSRGK